MFIVQFNTESAQTSNKRRDWERQLMDDFIEAIHMKQFLCADEEALLERLDFVSGHTYGDLMKDLANYIDLESPRYGKQRLPLSMYGIAQGYVNNASVVKTVNEKGSMRIPFSHYYDIRQRGHSIFRGCYVEVFKDTAN